MRLTLLPILFILAGCAGVEQFGETMEELGRSVQYNLRGEHYLLTKDFSRCQDVFSSAVKENSLNSQAHYYLGRCLLARKKKKTALQHLQKAAFLDPGDTDYLFWQGVAYGENGNQKEERKCYNKILKKNKKHLRALIYLAHNQLRNKEYEHSLATYRKALKIWPESPSSLYNQALILNILGRTPEEKIAWLTYLDYYPAGALARKATVHLNRLSDFSYRNHHIGARTITLGKIHFQPFTAKLDKSSYPSLNVLGATVTNMNKGTLHVVTYQKKNKNLARQRAISIKKYLEENFKDLKMNKRVQVSWFDVGETFKAGKKKVKAEESVRFFLTDLKK